MTGHSLGLLTRLSLGKRQTDLYTNIDWARVRTLHFLCKGNICRSAYAHVKAETFCQHATSSGLEAANDGPANADAIRASTRRNLSLDAHRSSRFDCQQLGTHDLVVAMEPAQAQAALAEVTAAGAQITLLGIWGAHPRTVIRDPYGHDDRTFDQCFDLIDSAVGGLIAAKLSVLSDNNLPDLVNGRNPPKSLIGRLLFRSQLHRLLLQKRAFVACFHSIVPDGPGDPLCTPLKAFDAYCRFFARHFTVVPLEELVRRLKANQPIDGLLAVTFDDGYLDNAQLARPVLEKYGIRATFFLAAGFIESDHQAPWDTRKSKISSWMAWPDVTRLVAGGHDVGAHTLSHCEVSELTAEALSAELDESTALIEHKTGRRPQFFAVPFGRQSSLTPTVRASIASKAFSATFTAEGGSIRPDSPISGLNRFPMNFNDAISPYEVGFDMLRDGFGKQRRGSSASSSSAT